MSLFLIYSDYLIYKVILSGHSICMYKSLSETFLLIEFRELQFTVVGGETFTTINKAQELSNLDHLFPPVFSMLFFFYHSQFYVDCPRIEPENNLFILAPNRNKINIIYSGVLSINKLHKFVVFCVLEYFSVATSSSCVNSVNYTKKKIGIEAFVLK